MCYVCMYVYVYIGYVLHTWHRCPLDKKMQIMIRRFFFFKNFFKQWILDTVCAARYGLISMYLNNIWTGSSSFPRQPQLTTRPSRVPCINEYPPVGGRPFETGRFILCITVYIARGFVPCATAVRGPLWVTTSLLYLKKMRFHHHRHHQLGCDAVIL